MLTHLLPYAFWYFDKVALSPLLMGKSQQSIPIVRVRMEEHRASEVRDFESFEKSVPLCHSIMPRTVQYECRVVTAVLAGRLDLACLLGLDSYLSGVFLDPVIPLMFFVCEER